MSNVITSGLAIDRHLEKTSISLPDGNGGLSKSIMTAVSEGQNTVTGVVSSKLNKSKLIAILERIKEEDITLLDSFSLTEITKDIILSGDNDKTLDILSRLKDILKSKAKANTSYFNDNRWEKIIVNFRIIINGKEENLVFGNRYGKLSIGLNYKYDDSEYDMKNAIDDGNVPIGLQVVYKKTKNI